MTFLAFIKRGTVERPDGRGGYRWSPGYSLAGKFDEGDPAPAPPDAQPWMTRREAIAMAKAEGVKARFFRWEDFRP